MGKVLRALAILVGVALIAGAVSLALMVAADRAGRLYRGRVELAFSVATAQYAQGDPARTVRATYEGRETELNPDRYKVLSYYMRQRAVKAYLPRRLDGAHIAVVLCGADTADLYRLSDDCAIVVFKSGGDTMKVRIKDDGLWESLVGAIK